MVKTYAKPPVRLVLGALLLSIFVALLVATYGAGRQLLFLRAATFYAFAVDHAWLLVGLYVLRLFLFLPASLMIVITGMVCGPLLGEAVAVAGLTLGGSVEFVLVRFFAGLLPPAWAETPLLRQWKERVHRSPFHSIFLMRICFVPFDAVNIAASLGAAPLRSFILATAIGVVPTSLPMVLSGASVDVHAWISSGHLWPGVSIIQWRYLALSVLLAVLTACHARGRWFGKGSASSSAPRETAPALVDHQ